MKIIESKIDTILRQTGINLAPYVINPYSGCQVGCLFCYSQFSKTALKEGRPWGSYVKVKMNAAEVLERELEGVKPEKVLLGSTTECFQPVESKYKIAQAVLRILNKRKIPYIILSRALLIGDYIPILKEGCCESVYFTVDTMPLELKERLEPNVPAAAQSIEIINYLKANGINATAYFCPVMPWLFDGEEAFGKLGSVEHAEFELLNFKMAAMEKLITQISEIYPGIAPGYAKLMENEAFYNQTMGDLTKEIRVIAKKYAVAVKIHSHKFKKYFDNIY